jgi:tetratricopeptide (TPR) repeat protein
LVEAEALARALDDRARLGRVLASMARVLGITGDHDGAMAVGQQALALAVELGENALQVEASVYLGQAYSAIDDFGRAAELLRLYTKIGQPKQARSALSAAIDLYCAMEMTFWLPEAEAALAQVE